MIRPQLKPALLLAGAGLAAGIFGVTIFFQFTLYAAGAWFGAATAICLRKLGILGNQQAGRFVLLSTVAYLLAFALGTKLHRVVAQPTAFVVAGLVGGLLVSGGGAWLVRPPLGGFALTTTALVGALCGALLAAAGVALGPSLGAAVSTIPSDPLQDLYSVFLVWQTGMGLTLGLLLGGQPAYKEVHDQ